MADDATDPKMSLLKRLCLRLDNGTRIGCSHLLGAEGGSQIVKLDFVEGFRKGIVSEDDLIRISEIAGQLDSQRAAAATPKIKTQVCRSLLWLFPLCLRLAPNNKSRWYYLM
jgi:hypothetical protein